MATLDGRQRSPRGLVVAFLAGIVVGLLLAWPTVERLLAGVGHADPAIGGTGRLLVGAVVGMVLVVLGVVFVYFML